MAKLKLESRGQYRNEKRRLVYRYAVKGNEADLARYREAQGEYYREDDKTGEAMYFNINFVGKTGTLIVTDDDKIYPDTSELEQQASLVAQLGGNLGAAMAAEIAKQMVSKGAVMPTAEAIPAEQ
jgi:hypothetical protein